MYLSACTACLQSFRHDINEGPESCPCSCHLHVKPATEAHDPVNHPSHYGGADNPYEAIKVIEAWELGFNLGNALKYISRHGKKNGKEDLKKAAWYLQREIDKK